MAENEARKVALDRLIACNGASEKQGMHSERTYALHAFKPTQWLTIGDLRELEKLIAEQAAELEECQRQLKILKQIDIWALRYCDDMANGKDSRESFQALKLALVHQLRGQQ